MTKFADAVFKLVPALWLGMVCGISFLETPLKFRAPEITLERGLGIGRIVFHALNSVELVFAAMLLVAFVTFTRAGIRALTGRAMRAAIGVAVGALALQIIVLRPALDRRLDALVRGDQLHASYHHVAYISLELAKIVALTWIAVVVVRATRVVRERPSNGA